MKKVSFVIVSLILLTSASNSAEPLPNILIISVDALRPDHLGCYGYDKPVSPTLDSLANAGVVFTQAFSSAAWTSPGLISLLTGRHEPAHGVSTREKNLTTGYIYLTARKKEILKVGGRRISPKEIEDVILEIPGVIDCDIDSGTDEFYGESIRATIYCNRDTIDSISFEVVREHCGNKLAAHKIPNIVIFKEQLNISAIGKKKN